MVDVGARPVAVEPETHDRLVAVFSHLPHVLANVLASQAAGRLAGHGEALRQVGPSFRDMTRVAGANTAMWSDIYRANRAAIAEEIRDFREQLERVEELLAGGETEDWNERARADRRALLESAESGGPVHELRLTVPNRPGIVAQVAVALGKAGVNIVDMALAPAADMRSGAITLWIAGDGPAGRAEQLIARAGLPGRAHMTPRSARFEPAGPLRGSYTPPADKSISHRAALFGAMADEPVTIRNFLDSADTHSTLDALRKLGAGVEDEGGGCMVLRGVGLHAPLEATGGLLDVGNSGTLMRLLPGWLAGQPGGVWTLDGDESIRRRPVDRVAEPLRAMGARVDAREGRFPPFTVEGTALRGIEYELPVASAQVKSCVLIAGMLAGGSTTVVERAPSRDHTERMLRRARVPFTRDGGRLEVAAVDELELDEIAVPGDPSSAAFVVAAATLVSGSRVVLSDVGLNWTRTGFFRIAERMGAVILGDLEEPGSESDREPAGELDVASSRLEGTVVEAEEVPLAIDELTLVALLGAFAEGETLVRGAEELRFKESNRIAAVVEGLRGLGADIEESADGFVVRGDGTPLRGGVIDSQGDHRLAMLGAVAGLASTDGVEVLGMDAAAVSYPGFEADLRPLLDG